MRPCVRAENPVGLVTNVSRSKLVTVYGRSLLFRNFLCTKKNMICINIPSTLIDCPV